MLNYIKRGLLVVSVFSICVLSGCVDTPQYHDGNSKDWIMEQVENGTLTMEEAEELLKYEEITNDEK